MNSSSVKLNYQPLFFLKSILDLTKARLAISVVFSSIVGYLLAAETFDLYTVAMLSFGGYCMVGASNSFNQIIEKDIDSLMERTKNRPIPSNRIKVNLAFYISIILTLLGIIVLYKINPRTALFGAISIFIYTCLYTPLKPITPLSVFVGAFPGAIPFMLGWVAATNSFGIEPGTLFMIQFFWQFPHFWAIGWMMDNDYKKAGFKMLPTGKPDKATAFQIVFYTLWTLIISLIPYTQYSGTLSLSVVAVVFLTLIGLYFLYFALKLMQEKTKEAAKKLMYASIVYISLLQMIYVLDKWI